MSKSTKGANVTTQQPPYVGMNVALETDPDSVKATVTLDGLGSGYEASAEAPRSHREPDAHIEFELAVSRALSRLQHNLMEQIHEKIDRTADDV